MKIFEKKRQRQRHMCGQTDRKFLDMCGQTDTKFLDMCGQTDTKILPTEIQNSREEEEERRKVGI